MSVELLVGLFAGLSSFLSGLLGIGGGIVLAPLLLYAPPLFGAAVLDVKLITGLTIVQAISGSTLGMFRHREYGNVWMRLIRLMGPSGAAASVLGAVLSREAPDRMLVAIFAAFSLINVPLLLRKEHDPDRTVDELHVNEPLAVAISVVLGFFGGMVGIGAIGFLLASMVYLLKMPVRIAIGTSLGVGMFAAVAALIGKAATAQVDPLLAVIVLAAAVVTSPIGAAVSVRTPSRVLMLMLAAIIALAGLRMAWQAIFQMG